MNAGPSTLERCPHCSSDARLTPHPVYRYKCTLCGKPRVPMDARLTTTDEITKRHLKSAHRQRMAKFGWQMGAFGAALITVATAILSLGASALFNFGAMGNATVAAMTLIPLVASVLFFVAGKGANRRSTEQIDEAWRAAVNNLYAASGGNLTAEGLAQGTGMNLEQAGQLLAEAEVNQFLGAGGELSNATAGERLRVAPAPSTDELAAAEQELEEALGNAKTQAFDMRLRK